MVKQGSSECSRFLHFLVLEILQMFFLFFSFLKFKLDVYCLRIQGKPHVDSFPKMGINTPSDKFTFAHAIIHVSYFLPTSE